MVQSNILQADALQSFKKTLQPQNVIQEEEQSQEASSSCLSREWQRQTIDKDGGVAPDK